MRYLLVLLLSLLVSGCSKEAPVPEPTAAVSTPEAAAKATTRDPVEEGDRLVYTDPSGFTISYPKTLYFNNDPEFLGNVKTEAQKQTGIEVPEHVGVRMMLFAHAPGTVAFNGNVNCVVEQVPSQAGFLTSEQYADVTLEQLKSTFGAKLVAPLKTVDLSGAEFQTADYTYTMPGHEDLLRGRFYVHYSQETRKAYVLTLTSLDSNYQETFPRLEDAVQTFTLD